MVAFADVTTLHEGFVGALPLCPSLAGVALPVCASRFSLQWSVQQCCLLLSLGRCSGCFAATTLLRRMFCRRCCLGGCFAADVALVSPLLAEALLLSAGWPTCGYFAATVLCFVYGGYLAAVLLWWMLCHCRILGRRCPLWWILCHHRRAGLLGGCFATKIVVVVSLADTLPSLLL